MTYPATQGALAQYQAAGAQSAAAVASPHRLIDLLMERALARLAVAKGHMQRADVAGKGSNISGAMAIIDTLKSSLDRNAGGELADNLDALYEYMNRRLLETSLHDDVSGLDEVSGLLREIRGAWQAIGETGQVAAATG